MASESGTGSLVASELNIEISDHESNVISSPVDTHSTSEDVGEKEESRKGSIENKNSGDKRKTKRSGSKTLSESEILAWRKSFITVTFPDKSADIIKMRYQEILGEGLRENCFPPMKTQKRAYEKLNSILKKSDKKSDLNCDKRELQNSESNKKCKIGNKTSYNSGSAKSQTTINKDVHKVILLQTLNHLAKEKGSGKEESAAKVSSLVKEKGSGKEESAAKVSSLVKEKGSGKEDSTAQVSSVAKEKGLGKEESIAKVSSVAKERCSAKESNLAKKQGSGKEDSAVQVSSVAKERSFAKESSLAKEKGSGKEESIAKVSSATKAKCSAKESSLAKEKCSEEKSSMAKEQCFVKTYTDTKREKHSLSETQKAIYSSGQVSKTAAFKKKDEQTFSVKDHPRSHTVESADTVKRETSRREVIPCTIKTPDIEKLYSQSFDEKIRQYCRERCFKHYGINAENISHMDVDFETSRRGRTKAVGDDDKENGDEKGGTKIDIPEVVYGSTRRDGKQGLFSSVGSSEWQEAVDKCTTYPVEYARQSMYGPASPPADMNDEYREDAVEDSKSSPTKEKINCFTCFESFDTYAELWTHKKQYLHMKPQRVFDAAYSPPPPHRPRYGEADWCPRGAQSRFHGRERPSFTRFPNRQCSPDDERMARRNKHRGHSDVSTT
ncbi:hypothetical protein EB796_013391 [Bugula neritina]|uniref:C2H2-type domain-containing protein n=1 Tax=Bugula neritina TaxID=10212 RepID=A0A7J7JQM6_BUGNE|nr:hypothetical protein EB796_013391 [Bugula neritina]